MAGNHVTCFLINVNITDCIILYITLHWFVCSRVLCESRRNHLFLMCVIAEHISSELIALLIGRCNLRIDLWVIMTVTLPRFTFIVGTVIIFITRSFIGNVRSTFLGLQITIIKIFLFGQLLALITLFSWTGVITTKEQVVLFEFVSSRCKL